MALVKAIELGLSAPVAAWAFLFGKVRDTAFSDRFVLPGMKKVHASPTPENQSSKDIAGQFQSSGMIDYSVIAEHPVMFAINRIAADTIQYMMVNISPDLQIEIANALTRNIMPVVKPLTDELFELKGKSY